MQSLSQANAGAGWGGEEGGVPPNKIYGYLAESEPARNIVNACSTFYPHRIFHI